MKQLNPDTFVTNEEKSNHAVQAFSTTDCPVKTACFGIATGFGCGMVPICEYFESTDESANCNHPES